MQETEALYMQVMYINLFTILFPRTLINYISVCLLSFQTQMQSTGSEIGLFFSPLEFLSELSRCNSTEGRKLPFLDYVPGVCLSFLLKT